MSDGMSVYVSKLCGVNKDYVITVDTDSGYIDMSGIAKKVGIGGPNSQNVDAVTKFADTKMKDESKRLAVQFHAMTNVRLKTLDFKREKVIHGAVFVARKRYIINVYDSEGVRYAEPRIGVTGLETNRSSTPKVIRSALEDAYKVIINGEEPDIQNFYKDFRTKFYQIDPNEISFPRGISDLEKYMPNSKETANTLSEWCDEDEGNDNCPASSIYKRGTPIAVRASLVYNNLIKDRGLDNKYPELKSGEKIRFIYLKVPNPISENVIAYTDALPPEFGLDAYVDYDIQFEKSFEQPLSNVLTAIGWTTEKKSSLADFF